MAPGVRAGVSAVCAQVAIPVSDPVSSRPLVDEQRCRHLLSKDPWPVLVLPCEHLLSVTSATKPKYIAYGTRSARY